jgi:hypothetical protein
VTEGGQRERKRKGREERKETDLLRHLDHADFDNGSSETGVSAVAEEAVELRVAVGDGERVGED